VPRFQIKFAFVVAATSLLGCGAGNDPDASPTFIALGRDFQGFDTWTAFDLGDDQDDGVTTVGHRRAYINQLPPTGSTTFPTRTIVIKTIGEDQPTPGQVFAMVKRGGNFNPQGAVGWEWFELVKKGDAEPAIVWRGITPPAGEQYAGIAGGVCNTCHAMGVANDYVPSAELLLSQF
jgi:hypothetical protein